MKQRITTKFFVTIGEDNMHILISGLVNVETSVKVRRFPIDYYPIDYPFLE